MQSLLTDRFEDALPTEGSLVSLWRWIARAQASQRKWPYMVACAVLVAVTGFADFLTGFESSMTFFYLLPVCLAVATVSWRFAVLTSVMCVTAWFVSDAYSGANYSDPIVYGWNGLIALSIYLIVAWLFWGLVAMQAQLEKRVCERTAALTSEIAERERLEKIVLGISERERRSIGRDLHDGLGQHLTGTALVTQALRCKIAQRSPEDARELDAVIGLIEQAIEQTRGLAKGLLLAEIASDGLTSALAEMAAAARHQHNVDVTVVCSPGLDLGSGGRATHLYRIAEEATRNAIRHGRAKRIDVSVLQEGGLLHLDVRDNGAGIAWHSVTGQGLGLRIMEHRAAIIGGTFFVGPGPQGGTLVSCTLPVSDQGGRA